MKIVALFAGCGGLDLGFKTAGFDVSWANEYDKEIWETYRINHPGTFLDTRGITNIQSSEIPDCDGIIGGPPCQSWSGAGSLRGIDDNRGKLFFDFIRILNEKKPMFFLAENVPGMLLERHKPALSKILKLFDANYEVSFKLLNVVNFGVPQDRKRVFFVGFRKDLGKTFEFPIGKSHKVTLHTAIRDLENGVLPSINKTNGDSCIIPNHEYMTGGFSTIFMSRNRVRGWNEPSFTIQASGRHAPIHPQAPPMVFVEKDVRVFKPGSEDLYRRLSVRECARIQTFPDSFIFKYNHVKTGYKMVGNAVPVRMARALACEIAEQLWSI